MEENIGKIIFRLYADGEKYMKIIGDGVEQVNRKKEYDRLDYFRIIAAFLVVAIHTSPLASFSGEADFIFARVIARIAVPFFFMTTGYFLLPQYLFGHSMDRRPILRSVEKHMLLYLAAILLYLPVNLYAGQLKGVTVGGFLRMLFWDGTFYHLWYLPAAAFGIVIVWFLGSRLPFGIAAGISFLLYIIGLFGDSYYGLAEQIFFLKRMYDMLFSVCSYTRNGLFYAPVFLVMGAGIYHNGCNYNKRKIKIKLGFILCFLIMITEGILLHKLNLQRHDSMYVMLPPTVFFLFQILSFHFMENCAENCFRKSRQSIVPSKNILQRRCGKALFYLEKCMINREKNPDNIADSKKRSGQHKIGKRLRGISMWIYLIHPLCIILIRGAAKAVHLEALFVENSLLHYFAVCTLSGGAACGMEAAAEKIRCSGLAFGKGSADYEKGRAWIELNRENLVKNVETLQALLSPGQQLMPAVKADAYGHGADLIAKELNQMGIQHFCVACAAEGVSLRKNGITGDILILGYTHPKDFPLLRKYRLTQTVLDSAYAKLLNGYGRKIKVHIKIDTGMHRLGERAENRKEIGRIFRLKNLETEGIYTHLCMDETREERDMAFTKEQAERFYKVVESIKKRERPDLKIHLLASYGLLNYPELGGDYVRIGIALYGVLSDSKIYECNPDFVVLERESNILNQDFIFCEALKWRKCNSRKNNIPLLYPVLSLRARITSVKEVYPGESVGYNAAFTADSPRKIAVLAIGYADGLPRSLSGGKGRVLIHGCSASILGRICMDQTIVDITEIPDVKAGEIATIIGKDGNQEITVYELAEKTGTITNEILSRLGARLPRMIR